MPRINSSNYGSAHGQIGKEGTGATAYRISAWTVLEQTTAIAGQTVLQYINNEITRFRTFVANRVEILGNSEGVNRISMEACLLIMHQEDGK